jgi:hypothetical protein
MRLRNMMYTSGLTYKGSRKAQDARKDSSSTIPYMGLFRVAVVILPSLC